MRKIINPWKDSGVFHCFGCSDANQIGLKMQFFEENDRLVCDWIPTKHYEGYINTLHGGIQATMHDEIASWVIYTIVGTAGVTTKLDVSYTKGVLVTDGLVRLEAKVIDNDGKDVTIESVLKNANGQECSKALIVYRIYSTELAIRKMHYPGKEAFFE